VSTNCVRIDFDGYGESGARTMCSFHEVGPLPAPPAPSSGWVPAVGAIVRVLKGSKRGAVLPINYVGHDRLAVDLRLPDGPMWPVMTDEIEPAPSEEKPVEAVVWEDGKHGSFVKGASGASGDVMGVYSDTEAGAFRVYTQFPDGTGPTVTDPRHFSTEHSAKIAATNLWKGLQK
jgi:hypothetical protein